MIKLIKLTFVKIEFNASFSNQDHNALCYYLCFRLVFIFMSPYSISFSDPDHNALCDHLPLCLCHPHLPLLSQTLHHHPSSRKERQVVIIIIIIIIMNDDYYPRRKLTMNTVKRPTVLAAAMPLMAATTVDAALCKGNIAMLEKIGQNIH